MITCFFGSCQRVCENLYENPRLTLSHVANELNTTTKTVSSTVNSGFKMNFNDFVNHYRIEAVKNKLNTGEYHTTTLLGIALDCGFSDPSYFSRVFKKEFKVSPIEWREKNLNRIEPMNRPNNK